MTLKPVRIIEQNRVASDTYVIKTERFFDFKAGQSVAISLDNSISPRLYSICSGVNRNYISILYKVVKGGKLTPILTQLKEGDSLLMSYPLGSFTHGDSKGVWIASGTGIAPFISMLESGVQQPEYLLHGIKNSGDQYFSEMLLNTLNNRYIPCLSQEEKDGIFHGRITDWLKQVRISTDLKYYLCGSPEMVVEVRDYLIENGVTFKHIASEIYF